MLITNRLSLPSYTLHLALKQERIQLHSHNSSVYRLTYYKCASDVTTLLLLMLVQIRSSLVLFFSWHTLLN